MLTLAVADVAAAQGALTPFQQEVLKAIYAVLPYQRERFALSGSDATPAILYSDPRNVERLECAANASFKILSQANEAGVIAVSVCPEHVARVRALAAASAQGFDTTLAEIQKGVPPIPPDKLRAVGWYRERSTLPGGAELHYFAVVLVGHGVIGVPTAARLAAPSPSAPTRKARRARSRSAC